MRYLEAIDQFVLEKCFERFTQWFQRLTGITTFWWARLMLVLLVVNLGVKGKIDNKSNLEIAMEMATFAAVILGLHFPFSYEHEKNCLRDSEKGFGNQFRSRWKGRILLLTILALLNLTVPSSSSLISWLLWAAYLYFRSCNILPPGRSKVRKMIDGMVSFLNTSPSPAAAG